MNRNIFLIGALTLLLACFGIAACHSGGGSGDSYDPYVPPTETSTPTPTPTEDPQAACLEQIAGTWTFATSSATGTLTMSSNGVVTGITQSTCSGMTAGKVDGNANAELVDGYVYIKYVAICNGQSYPYNLAVKFVDGKCTQLSGEKTGQYDGGHTENIALEKQ